MSARPPLPSIRLPSAVRLSIMVEKVNVGMTKNEKMVLLMDVGIISCFVLVFLLSLPRLFARFKHSQGALGPSVFLSNRSFFVRRSIEDQGDSPPETPIEKKDSPSTESSTDSLPRMDANTTSCVPLHVPSWSSLLYPLSLPFDKNVFQNVSGGKLSIMITLLAICLLMTFIASGNPFNDPKRLGWIATAFLPLTVALGTKNNLLGVIVGVSYEKVRSTNFL